MNNFKDHLMVEAIKYNIEKGIPLTECVFRRESEKFYEYFKYLKENQDQYELSALDKELVESDIGEFGLYEGKEVPLDLPFIEVDEAKKLKKSTMKDDPCWKGYTMVGTKDKNGKKVPNCVKMDEKSYVNVMTTVDGETFKSKRFSTKKEADDNHWKMINAKDKRGNKIYKHIETIVEAEEKQPELNSPKRNSGPGKKYYVYVKNDKGNVIKVTFGDEKGGLTSKINDPEARKSFVARHNCDTKKDKTSPGYWSCRLPYYAKQLGLSGGGNFFW